MKRNTKESAKKTPKLKLRKNDLVEVIAGEYKGVQGKVLTIDAVKLRVVVEGVNVRKRHMKPSADNPEGAIIEREMSIHFSNVMLVDGDGKRSRLGVRRNEEGNAVRFARSTGQDV